MAIYWFNKSSDLRGSAGALWVSMYKEHSDRIVKELSLGTGYSMAAAVWRVYLMLCGMSLELMYKAIIVAKGFDYSSARGDERKNFMTHELVKLGDWAGVSVNGESKVVLQLLTESIRWDGRYPVPKNYPVSKNPTDNRDKAFNKLTEDESQLRHTTSKANDALCWKSFNKIWLEASEAYPLCSESPTLIHND